MFQAPVGTVDQPRSIQLDSSNEISGMVAGSTERTFFMSDEHLQRLLTLRDFKGDVVTVECRVCNRRGELDRKALVKQHGAGFRFIDLRRRVALGCERMNGKDGVDRCQTRFPCLFEAGILIANGDDGT